MSENLDFDHLCKLYKNDPQAFEELRKSEIETLINKASTHSQKRLRGIQFQIDAKREIHKNAPFAACVEISKMMHESFSDLRYHLNNYVGNKDKRHQNTYVQENKHLTKNEAKVLNFRQS